MTNPTQFSVVCRVLMLVVLAVAVAGCAPPAAPVASDQSFRVTEVSTRYFRAGERPVPLAQVDFEHNRFPPDTIGLSRSRILADLKRALGDSVIAATRQGTREVRSELVVYSLRLRQGREDSVTGLTGWLDFYDARSGERVASTEIFVNAAAGMKPREIRAMWRTRTTVVREYDKLLGLVRDAMPKYLPRP